MTWYFLIVLISGIGWVVTNWVRKAQEKQFTNLIVGIVKIQFHLITIINVKNVKSISFVKNVKMPLRFTAH